MINDIKFHMLKFTLSTSDIRVFFWGWNKTNKQRRYIEYKQPANQEQVSSLRESKKV